MEKKSEIAPLPHNFTKIHCVQTVCMLTTCSLNTSLNTSFSTDAKLAIIKGLFRVKMHSLLLRPGSDNSISLWCKLRQTVDLSNYRSWFPFWDNCFVWLKFLFLFLFFETCTQPFCKRHYPVIVITITRHVLYTGKCTRLYILEIIKAWPLCILWTRGHAYLLTHLYKIKTFG